MTVSEPDSSRPSLAASASQRVQAILEAAEASAEEIRHEAQDEAEAIRAQARADAGRASESIEAAVRRLEELHGELGALIASLRAGEGAPPQTAVTPTRTAQVSPRAAEVPPRAAEVPPRAAEAPTRTAGTPPAAEEPPAAAEPDLAGVRLIALNMALDGTPREETAQFLAENFSLSDTAPLLDEVYASAEG
jgi:cell division septum initiation protein DivIVA